MTNLKSKEGNAKGKEALALCVFIAATVILIVRQQTVRKSVELSVRMCLSTIVPAIFPFMILSDLLSSYVSVKSGSAVASFWSKLFQINEAGIIPFLLGNVCGFPLGVKSAAELYANGKISKDECERLIGTANNPSLAFIISGVGAGMRGSLREGIVLYIAVLISSFAVCLISRKSTAFSNKRGESIRQNFSIVNSIKSSSYSVILVCAYIIFFSIIADLISEVIRGKVASAIVFSLLEIGSASRYISSASELGVFGLAFNAFALGFSGLSVYFQTLAFAPSDINKGRCFAMKLIEGMIAFLAVLIYSLLFKR